MVQLNFKVFLYIYPPLTHRRETRRWNSSSLDWSKKLTTRTA